MIVRFPMVQPVADMTRAALGSRLAPGASDYLGMFDENAKFEFPFSPGGAVRIRGRSAMIDYLSRIEGSVSFDGFQLLSCHPIWGGGAVLEYVADARVTSSGQAFRQEYIAVFEITSGRIRSYREYFNPLNEPGHGVGETPPGRSLGKAPKGGDPGHADDTVATIVSAQLDERLRSRARNLPDLFAEDGVLERPFALRERRLQGRNAITSHLRRLDAVQQTNRVHLIASHPVESSEDLVLEYAAVISNRFTGESFHQRYVTLVKIARGQVQLFREYWNPEPVLASFGQTSPALL